MDKWGIGVWGLVINQDRVLLVRNRRDNRGYWEAPGGSLDLGENVIGAVKREIKEETGVDVEVVENVEIFQYYEEERFTHWICLGYYCKYISGEIQKSDSELHEVKWFDINNLPLDINPNTKLAIESYKKD